MNPLVGRLLLGCYLITGATGCVPALMVGGTAATLSVAHDRRAAGSIVDDQIIELKAYSELYRHQELNNDAHISVTSYNYAVLLTGQVATPAAQQLAEQTVSRIDKVNRVYNELAVGPPSSFSQRAYDSTITAKVKTALLLIEGLPDFDSTRVKVVTEAGVVYLLGLLRPSEAEAVTNKARHVSGVQKVVTLYEYIE